MNVAIHKKTEYRQLAQNDFEEPESRTLVTGSSASESEQDEDDGDDGGSGLLSGSGSGRQRETAGRWFRSPRGVIVDIDPLQGGRRGGSLGEKGANRKMDMYQVAECRPTQAFLRRVINHRLDAHTVYSVPDGPAGLYLGFALGIINVAIFLAR